uniref:Zinc finger protein n=1 Tax=Talaromyces marneffei PM1 TaxID=1077442 RepID=A0A093UMB3_TALMA
MYSASRFVLTVLDLGFENKDATVHVKMGPKVKGHQMKRFACNKCCRRFSTAKKLCQHKCPRALLPKRPLIPKTRNVMEPQSRKISQTEVQGIDGAPKEPMTEEAPRPENGPSAESTAEPNTTVLV